MRYGDCVTNGEEYVALFDDVLVFDKDGNPQTKEQMVCLVAPKSKIPHGTSMYGSLQQSIEQHEADFLQSSFVDTPGINPTKIVVLGFLYKFLGQDLFDKLGYYKHVLVDTVTWHFDFLQTWRHCSFGTYPQDTVSGFEGVPSTMFFNALAGLAPFKDEIVTTMQANLDKLGFSNKDLGLYDCSNLSIRENDFEDKLCQRIDSSMVDSSIFRYNDFQFFRLFAHMGTIATNSTAEDDDADKALSERNNLALKVKSLVLKGFTSIPHYSQLLGERPWVYDAVPVVSYALVMDNQGMVVDFELIKAEKYGPDELVSAVKTMQSKHNFENIAIFVDNEWSQPVDYLASFKLEGISYMVNDHFYCYTNQQIEELLKSLKFSHSKALTLVNGAEPDRFACSNFESIDYANTPFEVTYKISEEDVQLMLQKGIAEVGAKGSHDILLDQKAKSLVFKGQTFITFMSSLQIKEYLLRQEDVGSSELDNITCGFKSFECDSTLYKRMGSKTGLAKSFNKFNTTKNLFKKCVEHLNLNKAAISTDGICGHMLSVYCAMVLRQLLQFHPHMEGKALSNDQINELFRDLFQHPFFVQLKRPVSKKAPASRLDFVRKSSVTFTNPWAQLFVKRGNTAQDLYLSNACKALGFYSELAFHPQMTMADLAKFLNMPQKALQRLICEINYNSICNEMAQTIAYDFDQTVRSKG